MYEKIKIKKYDFYDSGLFLLIESNLQCWWCDSLYRQLCRCSCFYWDRRCSLDHLLDYLIFRFDTNLWSFCISNAAVIKKNGDKTENILKLNYVKKYIYIHKDLHIFVLYCTEKTEDLTYLPTHVSLYLLSSFLCSIRQLVNYQEGVLVRCNKNALKLKHQLLKKTMGWSPTVH